jgi:hypothetical protein
MTTRTQPWAAPIVTLALIAGAAVAQDQQPAPEPPQQPAPGPPEKPDDTLPGLDDLLGLPGDQKMPAADDALRRELEDKLAGQQIAEQFDEAVRLMGQTADRIEATLDTGLATQRLQEDVIKKLDALIESAKKRNNSSSSSSSSSQRDKQQSQPNQPQSQQSQAGKGENRGQVDPPARKDGSVNPALDQTGAAWGGLPAHVRDALSQGSADAYSSLYRALTEAYYRRLAEEAGK